MSIVSPRAVSITIGTVDSRRISRQTSSPSIRGSITSSRTRSGRPWRHRSSPVAPSCAVSTSKPAARRPIAVTSRIDGSSSTSRIRASMGADPTRSHRRRGQGCLDASGYSAREVGTERGHGSSAPGIAALLSLLVPGLGQAWLGAVRRGLLVAAPVIVVLAALLGFIAGGDRRTLVDALLRPGVILALLVAIIGLGIYHVIAIQDAYRLGLRPESGASLVGAGRRLVRSSLLVAALAVAVAVYGTLAVVGVGGYQATSAIFVKPDTGFTIPEPSFEPTATPNGPEPTELAPPEPTPTPIPVPGWATDGRLNLLLIGSDAGPGRWQLRSDTMIVVSVDVATARTVLFGIPRNIINVPLPPESAK